MPLKVVISSSDYGRIMQRKEVSVADIMFTVVPDYAFGPAEELVRPSRARARKEFRKRAARRTRLAEVWNQPKPGGWFSRLLGGITTKKGMR